MSSRCTVCSPCCLVRAVCCVLFLHAALQKNITTIHADEKTVVRVLYGSLWSETYPVVIYLVPVFVTLNPQGLSLIHI